ncbi:conserved hypothetical protein [Leishmania infantum JPCM5]|uniref:C3H1-type domain-containing protein n=3 Tax=Leishmania donovani species complex TaxID=38574 RepID=A4HY05_LEIIN|nr:conserved hypothetical protein [Leishmania infantum JPCM5]XP_003860146.1 hypothetical protein, conserved [Leishmania donovani]CAC9481391.1 hypothetical_protein [Leishmania infantum]CAM67186.1 conserved hypothetical protein [Leishmania infantum JPCM5]CBZ33439.1 hypothetical protein, conserved [Leishmania donovani]SUZ41060.1 hypothetical_protein [Leishmania infantum]|eukprot:XP_001464946.1 conserved hypothetical protein [Leishmania infantum JPCM5]
MLNTGKSMTLNSHYPSSGSAAGMPAPGLAVSATGQSGHGDMASSPSISVDQAPTTPGSDAINFFAKALSSYKSHFGDSATGVVASSAMPVCSAPDTPLQKGINSGYSAGGPSRISLSGSVGASASSCGFAGSPAFASGNGVIGAGAGLHSNSSSFGNSPQTVSITPLVKFGSPSSACTVARPASPSAADGVACGGEAAVASDIVNAPEPMRPTCIRNLVDGVGAPFQAIYSSSSSSTSSAPSPLAQTTSSPQCGGNTSCVSPSGTCSLLFEAEVNISSPNTETASAAQALDKDALGETHQCTFISPPENNAKAGEGRTRSPKTPSRGDPSKSCGSAPSAKSNLHADHAAAPPKNSPNHSKQRQQRAGAASRRQHVSGSNCSLSTGQLAAESLQKGGSSPTSQGELVSVYDSDFETLLSIPASQVLHRPNPALGVSRLVLCRKFNLENPQSCSKGDMCKFVHADIRKASRCSIHVNYAWRSLALCTYPRLPAGDEVTVLAPNERSPSEVIPSERILVTRGSTNWREHTAPLSHCAHYYFNRMCNRGKRCNFIHSVHVDPNVQGDFKHAPAPRAVAPIAPKPSNSAASRAASGAQATSNDWHHQSSAHHGGAAARTAPSAKQPQPLPPAQQNSANNVANAGGGIAYAFAPSIFALPPHGCMAYPLLNTTSSPTAMGVPQSPGGVAGGAPYVMLMNSAGQQVGCSYVPATLMPSTPQQMGGSNGVFLIVPTANGSGGSLGGSGAPLGSPGVPVSPLGQSFSSLSNGPVNW